MVAQAVAAADASDVVISLRSAGSYDLVVNDATVTIGPDDVVITESPKQGWAVASDDGETVALDLELDDELRRIGLARDVIRDVQEARKQRGFDVTDRIDLQWAANGEVAEAIAAHATEIAEEVLAASFDQVAELAQQDEDVTGVATDQGLVRINRV